MTSPAPPPPDTVTLAALVAAQDQTRQQVSNQLNAFVTSAVLGFTGWYSAQAITAWATGLAADVQTFLLGLAGATDAYMATLISEATGRWFRPVGTIAVDALRAGITHAGAYGRVADVYRFQQARLDRAALDLLATPPALPAIATIEPPAAPAAPPEPPTLQAPIDAAVERATQVANLDTQLTVQRQSQATMRTAANDGLVTGWRRILHPELSKGGSCGLCIAASTRIYRVEHLMPIHHDCHCLPMPVTLHHDPGSIINDEDLGQFYADAGGSNTAAALKRTRYQINSHGELGPVLAPAGKRVRGPKTVAKQTSPQPSQPQSQARKDAKVRELYNGLSSALVKADALAADNPTRWGTYRDNLAQRVTDLERELTNA